MPKKYKLNEFFQQSDLTESQKQGIEKLFEESDLLVLPKKHPEKTTSIQYTEPEPTKPYEIIANAYDMEQAIRDTGKQNRSCSWRDSQKSSVRNQQYYRARKNIRG